MLDLHPNPFRLRFILTRFPRPVRRVVMQREQEGFFRRLAFHKIDRPVGEKIGEIALPEDLFIAFPKVVAAKTCMGEKIGSTRSMAEILVITAFERTEPWQRSEMPFTD